MGSSQLYPDALFPAGRLTQPAARGPGGEGAADLLRVLLCGSVDDGKSTLLGRILYDLDQVPDDRLKALAADSARFGTTGADLDFALLTDGLDDERQQGITIDVAHRFFASPRRSFIAADAPGHEQFTRNMATGASTCDAAILLVDARKGVSVQTRRHAAICSLMGIRSIVLAVNKLDLVSHRQDVFDRIAADFARFSLNLSIDSITPIPISARFGDNVVHRGARTPWYAGPTLIETLESIDAASTLRDVPFRFPIQWVNRPNLDFRGFSGSVATGCVAVGDRIVVAGSGRESTVQRIVGFEGDRPGAVAGDAVTLVLGDDVEASRGDMLAEPGDPPEYADQFMAHLIWMAQEPLVAGRQYLLKTGAKTILASVASIAHRVDIDRFAKLAATEVGLNEIAVCKVATVLPIAFDAYSMSRQTGSFILIDRFSNETVAAGMIDFAVQRARDVHLQHLMIDKAARSRLNHQIPIAVWFTGLSGAGKSTVADLVEQRLFELGHRTYLLDGDNVRHGVNRNLGFSIADRVENIRRVGEIAKLFVDAGTIVLCSFISPFAAEREMVRAMFEDGEFIEVFVDTPIEECIRRDAKGLYAKALRGEIANFTGLGSPYEPPVRPDVHLQTMTDNAAALADRVVEYLLERGVLSRPPA